MPTQGPTLKFLQGDENSCIICSLASALYEFGDIYASNYVYQRLKDVKELQTINWMVYLSYLMSVHHRMKREWALKYQATIWKSGKFDILKQYTEVLVTCHIQDKLGPTDHCITFCGIGYSTQSSHMPLPKLLSGWTSFLQDAQTMTSLARHNIFVCIRL